ncbi:YifB family Mg chelatase-like AAA ATPase [Tindallia californiensis]|uniref:Magnesium chelatase family protein n=1 Tax=Tindallia californiensis TaxID=159292 RepID=A0A1H3NSK4_9FIRM|nr:YifB family Mg chelatase-like AAA ATPase [Tindallia californiensis]SDY91901.1 magnesium chelatase family protein [Tindallia californiensis]
MLSKVVTASIVGMQANKVEVEVDVVNGLPAVNIVGLPDMAVKESRDRVRAAIDNSSMEFPMQRVTVNLSPADSRKEGTHFDLPIAIATLLSTKQVKDKLLDDMVVIGELSLDGSIMSVNGVLPMILELKSQGYKKMILPMDNYKEAMLVEGLQFYFATNLNDLVERLNSDIDLVTSDGVLNDENQTLITEDFDEVSGQENLKRAMEIVAVGSHNLLIVGPPGSGKTMLTRCLPGILPALSFEESMEVASIYSTAGLLKHSTNALESRPFRAPHHTSSAAALTGGGRIPRPGEISLSHHGVLFLDELPEFDKRSLEILRQPMEEGFVTISRSAGTFTFPANFMMIGAMNPCPCGYYGFEEKGRACTCAPYQIQRYVQRISGPLIDRVDLFCEARRLEYEDLTSTRRMESSSSIRKRIAKARDFQFDRYGNSGIKNANLNTTQIKKYCVLEANAEKLMACAYDRLKLSARAYSRLMKVSRSIADMELSEKIEEKHLAEALQFRTTSLFQRS